MKALFLISLFLASSAIIFAQNKINFVIKDGITGEKLKGVTINFAGPNDVTTSDSTGKLTLFNLPDGNITIRFSLAGYKTKTITYYLPLISSQVRVSLEKAEDEKLNEIFVFSNRTETQNEYLPTKFEVLG